MTGTRGGRVKLEYTYKNTVYTIYLGTITSISRSIQKRVAVTPIVSLDMQSAFPIENGNSQTISISFTHTNGQDNMVNAVWYQRLTEFVDRWQARTNGVKLYYLPEADNPYISDMFTSDDDDRPYVGGYIKSLTRDYTVDFNEVIKGTLEFAVGTMYVDRRGSKLGYGEDTSYEEMSVTISDSGRRNWYALFCGATFNVNNTQTIRDEYNCIDSVTISGGLEDPFESATIVIPKKKLTAQIPSLVDDIIETMNTVIVNCMGQHTMYVDRVSKSKETVTIYAVTYAHVYQQRTLNAEKTATPFGHIRDILSDVNNGVSYDLDTDLITNISFDNSTAEAIAANSDWIDFNSTDITFPEGTKLWRILQICAFMLRCRIFFADNKVYLMDYTKDICYDINSTELPGLGRYYQGTTWVPSMTLQEDPFKSRISTIGAIGKEGIAPVKNTINATYTEVENDVRTEKSKDVSDELSVAVYDVLSKGSEKLTELTEAQATQFCKNYLLYIREPQRSITFTVREMYGESGDSGKHWRSLFGASAQVGEIEDYDSGELFTNISTLGNFASYQKLCLSSYVRQFPKGTCEYTFGTVASVDLSNTLSQTKNTLNAPN